MHSFKVEYNSKNTYENPVKEGVLEFRICPEINEIQTDVKYKISSYPVKNYTSYFDWFGNKVFRFYINQPFKRFEINFKATLSEIDFNPFDVVFPPLTIETDFINNFNYQIDYNLYLQQTFYTEIPKNWLDQNTTKNKKESIWAFAKRLSEFLKNEYIFESGITLVNSTAKDFIELKKGVCMDFAHLFIGIFRANKIAARYASGYLYEGFEEESNLHSNSAMHAWAEFHIPSVGWVGIDPSNNFFVDNHYVKTCVGIDYTSCQPIKGVLKTHGNNLTSYHVHVVRKSQTQENFNQ